jgi:hypothetical protein
MRLRAVTAGARPSAVRAGRPDMSCSAIGPDGGRDRPPTAYTSNCSGPTHVLRYPACRSRPYSDGGTPNSGHSRSDNHGSGRPSSPTSALAVTVAQPATAQASNTHTIRRSTATDVMSSRVRAGVDPPLGACRLTSHCRPKKREKKQRRFLWHSLTEDRQPVVLLPLSRAGTAARDRARCTSWRKFGEKSIDPLKGFANVVI